nr:MAG TPA_asm: hypothetical protein [Caudoviricetes sp.]
MLCIYCINIQLYNVRNDSYYYISMLISIVIIIYFYR